jgi:hypothetical protein
MKNLQRLFALVIFTFLLSISVLAGDGIIHTWVTEPPPPPVATSNASATEGIIQIGATSTDPVAEVALSLLQGVLALF